MITPPALVEQRNELLRAAEADEEAAAVYADKAIELRRRAEIGRAEIAGIDRAVSTFLASSVERLVPRSVSSDLVAAGDDD